MFFTQPVRRVSVAIATVGLAIGLTACDQELTATVTATEKVGGSWIYADSNADIQAQADANSQTFDEQLADNRATYEDFMSTAIPTAVLSDWTDANHSGTRATFSQLTFDEFESAVSDAFFTDNGPSDVNLTKSNDRYQFGVVNFSNLDEADPDFSGFTLTFPLAVKSSNGSIDGKSVTWNFVTNPDLTNLFADTGMAKVPVSGKFTKVGVPQVGKTVAIKAPKAPAGATRTFAWLLGSKAIPGAAGSSLKIKPAMKGKVLRVKVTYTKPAYKPFVKTIKFGTVK